MRNGVLLNYAAYFSDSVSGRPTKKKHVELRIILEGGFCQGDFNVKNVCEAKNKQLTRIPELRVRMYI